MKGSAMTDYRGERLGGRRETAITSHFTRRGDIIRNVVTDWGMLELRASGLYARTAMPKSSARSDCNVPAASRVTRKPEHAS